MAINGLSAASVAVMVTNPFIKSCCSFTPWIIGNLPPCGNHGRAGHLGAGDQ